MIIVQRRRFCYSYYEAEPEVTILEATPEDYKEEKRRNNNKDDDDDTDADDADILYLDDMYRHCRPVGS